MSSSTEIQKSQKLNMAIPFVTFDDITKKFIINEDAIKIISKEENKQIGILSLVGKYRTGKSFLLNRVLIEKKSLFYNKMSFSYHFHTFNFNFLQQFK